MTFQSTRVFLVDNMNSLVSKFKPVIPSKWHRLTLLCPAQRSRIILVNRMISSWRSNSNSDWKKAVSEAEKVVGYPTSFLSLRYLLSDELSNVALQMRKLVGTRHPLLKTAKGLLHDSKQNLQTCGLIILLVAKAAGSCPNSTLDDTRVGGIYPNQRCLAELTEMIHTATLIHKGVLNLKTVDKSEKRNLDFGNKMAILSGDFLLASACSALAKLNNTKVVEIISESIKKIMESQFTTFVDSDGNGILKETITFSDWRNQAYLSYGNLLGYSCQAVTLLAGHGITVQENAYKFGTNLAYAHQISLQTFAVSISLMKPQFSYVSRQSHITHNLYQLLPKQNFHRKCFKECCKMYFKTTLKRLELLNSSQKHYNF
ncbi:decaprenyl-diphosphate synthase subunit 2 isoform X2 [Octopus sinensis]|uniref:Decaprenyl-diphosphate synthase subunit 2 isoform X2 n=1 Tax=Octopus sinensis TaxID=2607531 RepID=A0A7E6ESZ7_9MOLL|nr:decaprenyl-diphosphate synthase subunit 2 isoform X2 [Octopus sinensis]